MTLQEAQAKVTTVLDRVYAATSWNELRDAGGLFGLAGLILLAFHGFGVAPSTLAFGWIGGVIWIAKHWESWAAIACVSAAAAPACTWSKRETLRRLVQLTIFSLLGGGAVHGAWMFHAGAGFVVGVLLAATVIVYCQEMSGSGEGDGSESWKC